MAKSQLIQPLQFGENSRIDIQRDLNNGALIVVTEGASRKGYRVARENAIGLAMALLTAAGIPIEEAYKRNVALKAKGLS